MCWGLFPPPMVVGQWVVYEHSILITTVLAHNINTTIITRKDNNMDKQKERPKNKFVHCTCGVTYISGYTHCPSCGKVNPNDNIAKQVEPKANKTI